MLQLMPLKGSDEQLLVYSSSSLPGTEDIRIMDNTTTERMVPVHNMTFPGTIVATISSINQENNVTCFNTSRQICENL